jgi:hypothetical protein
VPSSGEIWNLLAAFSVYVFFAVGGWFTTWIDAVFFVISLELLIIR